MKIGLKRIQKRKEVTIMDLCAFLEIILTENKHETTPEIWYTILFAQKCVKNKNLRNLKGTFDDFCRLTAKHDIQAQKETKQRFNDFQYQLFTEKEI